MWTYQTIPLLRMLQATTDPSIHLKIGGGGKNRPSNLFVGNFILPTFKSRHNFFHFWRHFKKLKIQKPETDEEEKRRI